MVTALPRLAHIWIGHGESEKGVNGPRTASLYDSVFVARYSADGRLLAVFAAGEPRTIALARRQLEQADEVLA